MTDLPNDLPSYSYQGQDLFVTDVLGHQVGGYFLDSGASNGRKGSNTWLLESQYGWSGICVEPNAEAFRQLRANRGCVCLDCCLYDRDGAVDFLKRPASTAGSWKRTTRGTSRSRAGCWASAGRRGRRRRR